jgi:acyl-CoA thioesterase-1
MSALFSNPIKNKANFALFKAVLLILLIAVFPGVTTAWAAGPAPPAAIAKQKTIMFFGDSLVEGYGLPKEDALPAQLEAKLKEHGLPVRVINAGNSGETSAGGLRRLEWQLKNVKPDYVIICLGGNDMLKGIQPGITRENLRQMMEILQKARLPVLMAGMRHARSKTFDGAYIKMYQDLSRDYGAVLYPFILEGVAMKQQYNQRDGVHPNKEGVAVIVEGILPFVADLLVKKPPE